jgi:tetratricopeptide (TPR) repeat protein
MASVHNARNRFEESDRAAQRALQQARLAGDAGEEMRALRALGGPIVMGPTPVDEGIRRVKEIQRSVGDSTATQHLAWHVLGHLQARTGEFEEARRITARWRAMLRELGQELAYASTANCMWDILCLAGDWPEGERVLREAYEILQGMDEKSYLSTIAARLAEAVRLQGRLEEAERYSVVSEESGASDDFATQIGWRTVRAQVLVAQGEAAAAEHLAREAVELGAETDCLDLQAEARLTLAVALRAAERAGEASDAVEQAIALYERKGNLVGAERARAML